MYYDGGVEEEHRRAGKRREQEGARGRKREQEGARGSKREEERERKREEERERKIGTCRCQLRQEETRVQAREAR